MTDVKSKLELARRIVARDAVEIPSTQSVRERLATSLDGESKLLLDRCVKAIRDMRGPSTSVTLAQGWSRGAIARVIDALKAEGWEASHYTGGQREPANEIRIRLPGPPFR